MSFSLCSHYHFALLNAPSLTERLNNLIRLEQALLEAKKPGFCTDYITIFTPSHFAILGLLAHPYTHTAGIIEAMIAAKALTILMLFESMGAAHATLQLSGTMPSDYNPDKTVTVFFTKEAFMTQTAKSTAVAAPGSG